MAQINKRIASVGALPVGVPQWAFFKLLTTTDLSVLDSVWMRG